MQLRLSRKAREEHGWWLRQCKPGRYTLARPEVGVAHICCGIMGGLASLSIRSIRLSVASRDRLTSLSQQQVPVLDSGPLSSPG